MSDDLLARATRALRESDDEAPPPPVLETRQRIVATLRATRSSRVVWLRRVLPIAAILVTSSAWAAANGHLGGTMRQVAAFVGLADDAEDVASARAPSAPARLTAGASEPPAAALPGEAAPSAQAALAPAAEPVAPPAASPVADPIASSEPRGASSAPKASSVAARASARPPVSSAAPPASASADDPAQSLYAAAHQKHFTERDFAGALAAWEKYLRAAPGGRFAAEAQYNRAICLVRLGRHAEAKPALRAFADGGYGGYRQSEAKALLDALDGP